jgi:hypothetical protein
MNKVKSDDDDDDDDDDLPDHLHEAILSTCQRDPSGFESPSVSN